MGEWQKAVPVGYANGAGQVFVGVVQGPPLQVREAGVFDEGRKCIVLEFENDYSIASTEVYATLGLPDPNLEKTLRLAIHLSDARQLCHNLITALAGSGDRVANLIREKMIEAMKEVERLDRGDVEGG